MINEKPIEIKVTSFGQEAWDILHLAYMSKAPTMISGEAFTANCVGRNYIGGEVKDVWLKLQRIDFPAWSGEGPPPVGTVCEWRDDDQGEWRRIEVRYLSKHTALLRFELSEREGGGDCEGAYSPKDCQFRPIRTAEQIAEEKYRAEIDEIHRVIAKKSVELAVTATREDLADIAKTLYEANYRKQVSQ